jgi:hypothetical protein
MTFPHIVLVGCAAVFAGFGVLSLLAPRRMARMVEFSSESPTARVELRAMYGGLELGIAAFLVWAAFRAEWMEAALWATLLMIGAIGTCRLVGLVVESGARRGMWFAFGIEVLAAGAAGAALLRGVHTQSPEVAMSVRKVTPVMIVDRIEPLLPFWVERLGWEKTTEVPDSAGGGLGFVILVKDGYELMFQTWASVQEDAGATVFASQPREHTPLFIEVSDLADVQRRLGGEGVLVPERTTFYGSRETIVRTPYGQVVTFAQFPEGPGS